jgi:hypothetical protein
MLRCVGYIQEFTNLLHAFRISSLRPANGYLTPIGVDGTKEDRKMASTEEVLDHHLKCFGEGDLKGILSDYVPGAILFTPDGPLRGVDAMRPLFQALIAEFGKPGAVFRMKQREDQISLAAGAVKQMTISL